MNGFWKTAIVVGAIGAAGLASGYVIDNHRCQRITYEQARYDLPKTWLISATQCLDAARSMKLRNYARDV